MGGQSACAEGLKDAYKNEFLIGVAVNQRNITDPMQGALICEEFNSITAENDMKPQPTEPAEGKYNWKNADIIDCVTFWNLSDRNSWLGAENQPLLFDKDYKRKAVYDIVFQKK